MTAKSNIAVRLLSAPGVTWRTIQDMAIDAYGDDSYASRLKICAAKSEIPEECLRVWYDPHMTPCHR